MGGTPGILVFWSLTPSASLSPPLLLLFFFFGPHGGRKEGEETTWPTGRILMSPPSFCLVIVLFQVVLLLIGHLVSVGRSGRVRGEGGGLGGIGFGSRAAGSGR